MSATQTTQQAENPFEAQGKPALQVWTYKIPHEMRNCGYALEMPAGARVVDVKRLFDGGYASLVVIVNPRQPMEKRMFFVVGQRQPLPSPEQANGELIYLGTFAEMRSAVWHVFEVRGA